MKKLLIVPLLVLLIGCSANITASDWIDMQEICETNGGLKFVNRSIGDTHIVCNSGVTFTGHDLKARRKYKSGPEIGVLRK